MTLTKPCRQYMFQVKRFFPVKGKEERAFLKKLTEEIEDYCLGNQVETLSRLCREYGDPHSIANDYFSNLESDVLAKKLRTSAIIKRVAICVLILVLIATLSICAFQIYWYFVIEATKMVGVETVITIYD